MKLNEAYIKLIESEDFKEWIQNRIYSLKVIFAISKIDDIEKKWNFSFLSNEKLSTFEVSREDILFKGLDDVYSKDNNQNNDLIIEDIKLTYESSKAKILNLIENKKIVQEIIVISNNQEFGINWNFSEIASDLSVINVRVNNDGKIVLKKEDNLMQLGKWEKGDRNLSEDNKNGNE